MNNDILIATLVTIYSLSSNDTTQLVAFLLAAYLLSMQTSYRRAQKTAGLPQNWTPTQVIRVESEQQVQQAVQSIGETFSSLLRSFLSNALDGVDQLPANVPDRIATWMQDTLQWKAEQIANVTVAGGANAGTMQFVQDVLDAQAGDGTILDDAGNILIDLASMDLTQSEMGIQVIPGESSSDFCKEYAGNIYRFGDAGDLPEFPVHPNCIHSCVIVAL